MCCTCSTVLHYVPVRSLIYVPYEYDTLTRWDFDSPGKPVHPREFHGKLAQYGYTEDMGV